MTQVSPDRRFASVARDPGSTDLRSVLCVVPEFGFRSYLELRFEARPSVQVPMPPSLTRLFLTLVLVANEPSRFRRFAAREELGTLYGEMPGASRPVSDEAITKYVARIRNRIKKKLEKLGLDLDVPEIIETDPGAGYRLTLSGLRIEYQIKRAA